MAVEILDRCGSRAAGRGGGGGVLWSFDWIDQCYLCQRAFLPADAAAAPDPDTGWGHSRRHPRAAGRTAWATAWACFWAWPRGPTCRPSSFT